MESKAPSASAGSTTVLFEAKRGHPVGAHPPRRWTMPSRWPSAQPAAACSQPPPPGRAGCRCRTPRCLRPPDLAAARPHCRTRRSPATGLGSAMGCSSTNHRPLRTRPRCSQSWCGGHSSWPAPGGRRCRRVSWLPDRRSCGSLTAAGTCTSAAASRGGCRPGPPGPAPTAPRRRAGRSRSLARRAGRKPGETWARPLGWNPARAQQHSHVTASPCCAGGAEDSRRSGCSLWHIRWKTKSTPDRSPR
jgi:hypothetical protein